jgi:radical SAM protein with 4Fe4S-binding SPASM domain
LNELLLSRLIRTFTFRRLFNLIKTGFSFLLSAILQKSIVWGIAPTMTIEPTNICNLKCPLCTTGAGEMKRSAGKMSLDTFDALMNKMGDDIFFLLIYHQGEPYINQHFFDFVKIAKKKNIYVTTSTNGHYFTKKNISKSIESGLDSMIVSIDGVTQESFEKYRVKGNLEKVVQGTKELMQERKKRKSRTPNVALQFLVMKHNESEIEEIQKLGKEMGVDRVLIKNIEVRSFDEALEWLPQENSFRRYNVSENEFIVKGQNNKKSCSRPWMSTLINWDGTFVPCCFDKNGQYPMGNIHKTSEIRDIWMGDTINDFRKKLLADRKQIDICANCNMGFGSFLPTRFLKKQKITKKTNELSILDK